MGTFLISLGLALIVVRLDLLGLGEPYNYFNWKMLLILFGVWSLISFELLAAVVLISLGVWFMLPDIMPELSGSYRQIYWPAVLVLAGIAVIVKPLLKKLTQLFTKNR